ncbi:MAG: hemerythrin domain-containing protein [Elusimicrobia bacterium]|nr:hemerythrin domain-containing protein [Elusimicrobiota bacterium]
MKALDELAADHRVFEQLLGALEGELARPSHGAPSRVERLLRALLQGLDAHEAAEDIVCGARGKAAHKREHADFEDLREVLDFVLDSGVEANFTSLRATLQHLDERLRAHFRLEEESVWPVLRRRPPRLSPKAAAALAGHRRALARLKDEVLAPA